MAVTYDEKVIIEFAARLYRRASAITLQYVLVAGGFGALVVFAGSSYAARSGESSSLGGLVVLVAVVGGALGYAFGTERGFALRLMAQTALCQLQIERNTRAVAMARAVPPPIPREA